MPRVVFLGQKWLGDRCFERLLAARSEGVEVVGAVSNAEPTAWWGTNGVRLRAGAERVVFLDNGRPDHEAVERLVRETRADVLVAVQHPWILPASTLVHVGGRAFNLHSAPLPGYGGHNACNHALLNGEPDFGVTLHRMVEQVDAGPVVVERRFPVEAGAHARSLYDVALAAGEDAFGQLAAALAAGEELPESPLPPGGAFHPRSSLEPLRDVTGVTDETELDTRVRALYFPPFEPAYRRVGDVRAYLLPAGFERYAHEFRGRLLA